MAVQFVLRHSSFNSALVFSQQLGSIKVSNGLSDCQCFHPKCKNKGVFYSFLLFKFFSNSSYISPIILFLRECSIKMFLQRGSLQEMRNWYKASIRSKSVRNTKLIESTECFLFVLFLDIPDSCNKTTHWSVISAVKKKENKRISLENEGKQF